MFQLSLVVLCVALVQSASSTVAVRVPCQPTGVKYELPAGPFIEEEFDASTGEFFRYDPQYEIAEVDSKKGVLAFRWVTSDGKHKEALFQRSDAIEVTVAASVSRTPDGLYRYDYLLSNAKDSALFLSGFLLQTFADDVRVVKDSSVYVGFMSNDVRGFAEGRWVCYGEPYLGTATVPGAQVEMTIESRHPPCVVRCRVSGGELLPRIEPDPPGPFEDVWSSRFYAVWPRGYTIGPSSTVGKMRLSERITYVASQLQTMETNGWMTSDARAWYAANLKSDSRKVLDRLESDLKTSRITSEVYALVREALLM